MQGVTMTWDAVGIVLTAVTAWSGLLLAIIKWLLNKYAEGIKDNFKQLGETIRGQTEEMHRLDKEILKLRGEIVREYVRRDDAIREQVVINAKLDALAAKIENLRLRSTHAD